MSRPSYLLVEQPEPVPRPDWTAYAPLDAPFFVRLRAATRDLVEGFRRHRSWRYLAAEHVKNQYRRTVIGPWWITLQAVVFVLGIGVVFGQLRGEALTDFLPYVAVGYLTFILLSGLTRAGANIFTSQAGMITSTRQPLSSLVLRAVTVELIQFAHNMVIVAVLLASGVVGLSLWLALAPVAVVVVLVNGVAVGLWLGPVVARFRDVAPAIDSVLQVMVFFTPLFYKTSDLGSAEILVRINPYTYFIDLVRSPVLGEAPTLVTLAGAAGFTAGNLLLAVIVFARCRSRVPYWVA